MKSHSGALFAAAAVVALLAAGCSNATSPSPQSTPESTPESGAAAAHSASTVVSAEYDPASWSKRSDEKVLGSATGVGASTSNVALGDTFAPGAGSDMINFRTVCEKDVTFTFTIEGTGEITEEPQVIDCSNMGADASIAFETDKNTLTSVDIKVEGEGQWGLTVTAGKAVFEGDEDAAFPEDPIVSSGDSNLVADSFYYESDSWKKGQTYPVYARCSEGSSLEISADLTWASGDDNWDVPCNGLVQQQDAAATKNGSVKLFFDSDGTGTWAYAIGYPAK